MIFYNLIYEFILKFNIGKMKKLRIIYFEPINKTEIIRLKS